LAWADLFLLTYNSSQKQIWIQENWGEEHKGGWKVVSMDGRKFIEEMN
jgi:hypothetical protein